ncbi:NadS family protein [Pollutimonas bauzanensis]|uniref:Helix-turn-helix domain-containing protein n=1 Tax=Pollutimonas bauzanensis TaxID=658167 RepID=A0A1M5N2B5_9BURK|nr:NadS family protein [Pollutimonas bauzanensis]SHG83562.1 Helix-turn-helix domain-containing protein [Pollutimonas bauzanensis]
MDEKLFSELKLSLRQAKAIRAGQLEGRRTNVIDVKAVRERTRLSQGDFAAAINVSVRTLQNWEQRRRAPTGPAVALLKVVASAPDVVLKALHH